MAPTSGFEKIDDLLAKSSVASKGGAAALATNSGAGEQPAPETVPQPVVLSELEIRKSIRTKMAALLAAHPKLLLAQAAKSEADGVVSSHWQAFKNVALPKTDDDKAIGSYVAECQERHSAYMEALAKLVEPQQNLLEAEAAWAIASSELDTILEEQQWRADVAHQDYFLAARHLQSIARSTKIAGTSVSPVLPEGFVMPAADKAVVATLRGKTFALLKALGAVEKAAPDVVAANDALEQNATAHTLVKPPSRPTEEEIQRYLTQMERVFSDRLAIHRRVISTHGTNKMVITRVENSHKTVTEHAAPGTRADLLERLANAYSEQCDALSAVQGLPLSLLVPEVACATECAQITRERYSGARNSMGDSLDSEVVQRLDNTRIANPRSRETRQMSELRKLMRGFAVATAKHNEATAALKAAERLSTFDVKFNGAAQSKSWQEVLDWHAGKVQQKQDADHKNASRAARIELLQEQVRHMAADVENSIVSLERYVETIRPPQDDPSCDEKRILMRASRVMCVRKEKNDH